MTNERFDFFKSPDWQQRTSGEKKKNDFALFFFFFFLLKYSKACNASRFLASPQRDRQRGVWLDLGPRLLLRARHQQRGATGVGGRGLPPLAADRPQKPQGNTDGITEKICTKEKKRKKKKRVGQRVMCRNCEESYCWLKPTTCNVVCGKNLTWCHNKIQKFSKKPLPQIFSSKCYSKTDSAIKAAPTAVCRYQPLIKISLTSSCSMKWIFISVENVVTI